MRNIEDVIKHINKDFVTLRISNVKEPALSDLEMDAVILIKAIIEYRCYGEDSEVAE